MSDWEERGTPGDIKRGEIFGGSTWSEVACMLTYAELPGIYISKDKGQVTVLDNFEAEVINKTSHSMEIKIYNPSDFDAKVKVMSESSDAKKKVLPLNYFSTFEIMDIKAKESKILRYNL
jgi:hypothetical protein